MAAIKRATARRYSRTRLPSLRSLRARADDLWAQIVRRHYPICTVCGERPTAQAHHVLSRRRFSALRYAPEIGIGICARCHLAVHDSPLLQTVAMTAEETARLLVLARSAERTVWNRGRLLVVILDLENMLNTTKTGQDPT